MKIVVDVSALMFIMSKCIIHHPIEKEFSFKVANDILNHEALK